jgi:endonuclease/exonuclease/phosphatase family metal-dependent hydrolase
MARTRRRITVKRLSICLAALGLLVAPLLWVLPRIIAGDRASVPEVKSTVHGPPLAYSGDVLPVVTLNLAHGRKNSTSQLLLKTAAIRENLDDITSLLAAEKPLVVALQEADGPSFWSGKFDHVAHLADGLQMANYCHARNVDGASLVYGTALLANLKLTDAQAVTFAPGFMSPPKGAIIATVEWPGGGSTGLVDLVSVHLDFVNDGSRASQLDELAAALEARSGRPLIVLGDFNCDWQAGSPLRTFATRLDLHTYQPEGSDVEGSDVEDGSEDTEIVTFPALGSRIDWILLSTGLEFAGFEVLEEVVSDHRAVVALIRRRG